MGHKTLTTATQPEPPLLDIHLCAAHLVNLIDASGLLDPLKRLAIHLDLLRRDILGEGLVVVGTLDESDGFTGDRDSSDCVNKADRDF